MDNKMIAMLTLLLVSCATISDVKLAQKSWYDCVRENTHSRAWITQC